MYTIDSTSIILRTNSEGFLMEIYTLNNLIIRFRYNLCYTQICFTSKYQFKYLWINSQNFMQGKGFEPSDSFETGYLIEPLLMISDLKSCAVGQAWLPLQMKKTRMPDHMRTPGLEPGQRAWKALIITARSHPLEIIPFKTVFTLCQR